MSSKNLLHATAGSVDAKYKSEQLLDESVIINSLVSWTYQDRSSGWQRMQVFCTIARGLVLIRYLYPNLPKTIDVSPEYGLSPRYFKGVNYYKQ